MDVVEVCTLPLRDHHSHQQSLALVLALLRHYNKHVVSGHFFESFEFTSLILSKTSAHIVGQVSSQMPRGMQRRLDKPKICLTRKPLLFPMPHMDRLTPLVPPRFPSQSKPSNKGTFQKSVGMKKEQCMRAPQARHYKTTAQDL